MQMVMSPRVCNLVDHETALGYKTLAHINTFGARGFETLAEVTDSLEKCGNRRTRN